jgi:diguanylate cyclase (GGDEF)-like protein
MNFLSFYITEQDIKKKTEIILQESQNTLNTHYNILLESQKHIAYAIYKSILRNTDAITLLENSYNKPKEIQAKNRKKLYNELSEQYVTAKKQGVLQLQFVFKDNISFLRVHTPSKFADDLSEVRKDFKKVNKTYKMVRAFTQGRTSHGFRNTFPIFNKEGKHIGAMEISFTSNSFQWYLNNISHIHSHFLVYKEIFSTNAWKRDDLILHYKTSAENDEYMLNLNKIHTKEICIDENRKKLFEHLKYIKEKMKLGKEFGLVSHWKDYIQVVSFLPIKDIENKSIAWIVSYKNSPIILSAIENALMIRAIVFFLSLVIIYFLATQIKAKVKLQEQNIEIEKKQRLLHDLLNLTDNIMFITDFKRVKYANNRFKNLLNIEYISEINKKFKNSLSNMFVAEDGCLHNGLLKEGESFPSLFKRTAVEDRVVTVIDKSLVPVSFKISLTKTENNGDYLVTLTDITQMRKQHQQVQRKASFDKLTGLYNRMKFDDLFLEKYLEAKEQHTPLSVAILDIDKFKDFNDNYGHLIGDEVLIEISKNIKSNIRESDIVARWGGEEFVILFVHTPLDEAVVVVEKLRKIIAEHEHKIAGKISASFGLSDYREDDSIESIFNRCDKALYRAKANGRNRVEVL